jgi:pimeloyl-ACP methyl ester carboxylesterase
MATPFPSARTSECEEGLVALEGGRIRLLTGGEGPPLLYLHGVGDLGSWLPLLAHLGRTHRVIRPDHPGFNGSDDFEVRSPAEVAGVHLRLLDELGIDELDVVGCSFGGWVATELALLAPERVRRLLLIDPAGMPADEQPPDVLDLDPVAAAPLTFAGPEMQRTAQERARAMDAATLARDARNRATARRLAGDPYLHDPALPSRAGALRLPVTLVWGEEDRIVPLSHARTWTASVPQAQLRVVPRAGHLPHAEQPADFLARAGLGAPAN